MDNLSPGRRSNAADLAASDQVNEPAKSRAFFQQFPPAEQLARNPLVALRYE